VEGQIELPVPGAMRFLLLDEVDPTLQLVPAESFHQSEETGLQSGGDGARTKVVVAELGLMLEEREQCADQWVGNSVFHVGIGPHVSLRRQSLACDEEEI